MPPSRDHLRGQVFLQENPKIDDARRINVSMQEIEQKPILSTDCKPDTYLSRWRKSNPLSHSVVKELMLSFCRTVNMIHLFDGIGHSDSVSLLQHRRVSPSLFLIFLDHRHPLAFFLLTKYFV